MFLRASFVSILLGIAAPQGASAITFVSNTPIAGDSVAVTVTLLDAPGGNGVDVTVSIPPGQGDLLGFFGNATPETLVPSMAVVDPTGLVTQWQFAANQVWKVGGGNVMSPVKNWDFGLRFASQGSAGGAVTSASFRLAAPGLTTTAVTNAFNQGWRFGIRIQSTLGPEGSAKIGVSSTAPPVGQPPTIAITAPAGGALLDSGTVAVSGTVTGTPPVSVSVNGVAATVTGSSWTASLVLADGDHTLAATATNTAGSASESVAIAIDTSPPVVTITSPADGTPTTAGLVTVTGTVADASPIASFTVNGLTVPLVDGAFTTTVAIALGANAIVASATDAAGNSGSGAITVVRGEAPTVAITAPTNGLLTNQTPIPVAGTFAGTDPVAVTVNGVAAAASGGSWTASVPLVEGGNTLTADAMNSFGAASATVSVTLDTTPPLIAISTPADGTLTEASSIAVTGTVSDATSGVAGVTVNGVAATVTGDSFSATIPLSPGANAIDATATDLAGNSATSAAISVTRGEAPTIAITAPADGLLTSQTTVAVTGTVTGTAPVGVVVNGVSATIAGETWTANVPLTEGANSIAASATNGFGSTGASIAVTLDTIPPVVTITAPVSGATLASQPAAVAGTVVDASPIAALRLNGSPLAVTSPFEGMAALVEGANVVVIEAVDAAGNTGSASVAVTYTPATPLAITIETPPSGALFSKAAVEVAGAVSDAAATVRVNGVLATVTGQQWVASRVPLSEGANTLTATATRLGATATAAVAVTYNAPPLVIITSPVAGALFRTDATDVEGVVDDPAAFVDVNGVIASVGTGGRFTAFGVPLVPGDNTLIARAIDALGAKGSDSVAVLRDDAAAARTRLLIPGGNRWTTPIDVVFTNLAEWEEGFRIGNAVGTIPRPFDVLRERFLPTPEVPTVFPQPQIFLLSETPDPVDFASFVGDEAASHLTQDAVETLPIEDLAIFLPPEYVTLAALEPSDFGPRFFAVGDGLLVPCIVDSCPPGSIEGGRVRLRATQDGVQREIELAADASRPEFEFLSPNFGSVLAGNVVTVTGEVRDAGPLLDSVSYSVIDEFGIVVQEGLAPLLPESAANPSPPFRGHFAIPDLVLGGGYHFVNVTAWDSLGNGRSFGTGFTIDAEAPAAALYSPLDGSAFVESEVQASLNFGASTTLVSVNGVPDGRSFPAGVAPNVLMLPLALGPNVFQLEVENSAGVFSLAFTLHRVATQGDVRIIAPVAGGLVNTHTLTVTGTAPLGTPVVLVNGALATIAPDRVSFSATIPVPSTGLALIDHEVRTKPFAITAEALPFGGRASIEITPDFLAPSFRVALPQDGAVTSAPTVALSGFVSEAATVSVDTPSGPVSVRTVRDRAREAAEPFNLFSAIQYHRYELPPIGLVAGANAITLQAVDAAGNETTRVATITRADASLALVSPAAGSSVAELVTSVTLHAAVPVTIDAFFVAGRQLPALGGIAIAAGVDTPVAGIPLVPGTNDVRIVYHRAGSASEVLAFGLVSTATDYATVSGQVTDQRTGAAIGGALVSISAGGVSITLVTDANGNYLAQVSPGAVAVTTVAQGYAIADASGSATAGGTLVADLGLSSTGIPAVMNEVRILVPPAGAVTDFEMLTVVGTVINPNSNVTVNGIPAQVVGNRFTAKHVPLAMGANTIAASAAVLGLPNVSRSVAVERSNEPVLRVKIFSPPNGASIPGGGLVVRGFASARQSRVLVVDRFAPLDEGLFIAEEVDLQAGTHALSAVAQLGDGATLERDEIQVTSATSARALELVATPTTASVPFDATLALQAKVTGVSVARLDFDLDGDRVIDVAASPEYTVETHYADARPYVARAYAALPNGAELSAATRIGAYLPPTVLRRFATGNPVDLVSGPGGNLFVLDGAAGTVSRYDRDGNRLDFFGASGAGSGQLSNPQAFAIAPDGRVYVADTGNDRIQVFDAAGTFERSIGTSGSGAGQLRRPAGIVVTEDRILVADPGNQRIAVFDLQGNALGPFGGVDARGLVEISGQGVLVASPQTGLLALVDTTIQSIPRLEDRIAAGELGAPVDVAPGDDGVWLADASAPRLWSLTDSLGFRRSVEAPTTRLPVAVANGLRREVESVYVADGTEVTEIVLPTPSPLPVVNELKSRLIASDAIGALAQIHPLQRSLFSQIYADRGADLAADAAAMESFSIDLLREDRAIVRLHHTLIEGGAPVPYESPIELLRAEDGTWQIYDY